MKGIGLLAIFTICTALVMQSVSFLLVNAEFNLNLDFIASNLCEKRDAPQMHCNGKCYLMNQMNKEKENSEAPRQNSQQITLLNVFFDEPDEFHFYQSSKPLLFPAQSVFISDGYCRVMELPPGSRVI